MLLNQNDWQNRIIVGGYVGGITPPGWLPESYAAFHERVADPNYPCYFGTFAENNGDLFYTFAESSSYHDLAHTLYTFIDVSNRRNSRRNNLVAFFKPEPEPLSHDDYRDRMWSLLQQLHDHDYEPWNNDVPPDPDHHLWEFCYGGTAFFVVALAPTYVARKSRNMGDGMILLFQPRHVFLNPETGENIGSTAREAIRERIRKWDDIDVHPDLGAYGDPHNKEWKQYFLSDDMKPETRRCPFAPWVKKRQMAGD